MPSVSVLRIATSSRARSSGESRSAGANGASCAACRISLAYARPMPTNRPLVAQQRVQLPAARERASSAASSNDGSSGSGPRRANSSSQLGGRQQAHAHRLARHALVDDQLALVVEAHDQHGRARRPLRRRARRRRACPRSSGGSRARDRRPSGRAGACRGAPRPCSEWPPSQSSGGVAVLTTAKCAIGTSRTGARETRGSSASTSASSSGSSGMRLSYAGRGSRRRRGGARGRRRGASPRARRRRGR